MKVFIIDDNVVLTNFLKIWFEINNHYCECSNNPYDVMEYIEKNLLVDYDYIIVDLLLNGINGLDIIEKLKEKNMLDKVIVLSGCDENYNIYIEAKKLNIPVIKKGIDIEELTKLMEKHIVDKNKQEIFE